MLICPVCRSQNMESAKFCGNCGNPFSKQTESTSSLINCPQGHIYSAVYQHCPYCPQPSASAPGEIDSPDFVTRVEDLSTSIDFKTELQSELQAELQSSSIGAQPSVVQNLSSEFTTRVGAKETLFEPPPEATSALASPQPQSPLHAPTEVISAVQVRELGKLLEPEPKPMAEPTPVPVQQAPAPVQHAPAPVQQIPAPEQQPSALKVDQVELDRRTIVVAEQAVLGPGERGKIVGWLITYSRNEDGQDFRIYEGYNRIGANQVCDIVIEDETVSGSHAIIVYREDRCLIKDDLSRNGTFVNGREITEAYPLQNYDQIRVGNTHLTYVAAQRAS